MEEASLPELTPTRMTLELADRSITRPKGVAEEVFVKVGKFHFPTDFVVVDFEADPRVPLILERSFLRTGRALYDVYGEEITLRVNDEAGSDFILEQIEAYLKDDSVLPKINHADCDPKGDICLIEKLLNSDLFQLSPMDLKQKELAKAKSLIEEPSELELKDLPSHLEYAYLEGVDKLLVIIAKGLKDDEKEALLKENITFTCPYGTFSFRRMPFGLCNAPGTFQTCMMAIFHDMIEKTMEVLMDEFLVFGDSFSTCLSHLDTMLQWCEDTNLVLNWEKCHFMVKEGIVLGHKISKNGFEVDRAKVDVIAKLPHPTIIKETPFVFSKDCIDAFETLKKKLTEAPILIVPDWNLPFELMSLKYLLSMEDAKLRLLWWVFLLQEFDIIICDKKGTENLAADHLSRLENPHKDVFENKDINENFPLDTLGKISSGSTSWFEIFDVWGIDFMGLFPSSRGNRYSRESSKPIGQDLSPSPRGHTIEGSPGSPNFPHGKMNAGIESSYVTRIDLNFLKTLVFGVLSLSTRAS
uniref:Reverse transcriptase domain-containing protein n=1 Tax=Tanacetum cinerariifolium TaxID=118510 RepID=A0A6L2KM70_TANCI|nr:reverse transcriptase domain-containing protein [Tanacetum cinerariifolium]